MSRKKGTYDLRQAQKFMYDRVRYCNDEQYLKIVARKNPNSTIKEMAIKKIHDQKFLYEFILTTKNSHAKYLAAQNIKETELKKEILNNLNFDAQIFSIFLEEVSDDLDLIFRCLKNTTEPRVFEQALPLFKSRKHLVKLKDHFEKGSNKEKRWDWNISKIIEKIDDRIEAIPRSIDFIMD